MKRPWTPERLKRALLFTKLQEIKFFRGKRKRSGLKRLITIPQLKKLDFVRQSLTKDQLKKRLRRYKSHLTQIMRDVKSATLR